MKNNKNCWCKFEPTTKSAPLGCDASMKDRFSQNQNQKDKKSEFFKWFGPPPE